MSNCSDCSDNRLFTLSVSPVTGLTADQPAAAPTADIAIRTAIKPTKIRTGSGRALPSRSTPSRKRLRSCTGCGVWPPDKLRMTSGGSKPMPEVTVKWRDYTGRDREWFRRRPANLIAGQAWRSVREINGIITRRLRWSDDRSAFDELAAVPE